MAEKYRDQLLDLHAKNRLLYQFEPAYSIYPVTPFTQGEVAYQEAKELHDRANEFEGAIFSSIKGFEIPYRENDGKTNYRLVSQTGTREDKGWSKARFI